MNDQVKRKLTQHFELTFGGFVMEEAEAVCKHCHDATKRGRFNVPFESTLETPVVRRSLWHARRCATVQRFIVAGDLHRLGGKRAANPIRGDT
jgi:hypothetical protein